MADSTIGGDRIAGIAMIAAAAASVLAMSHHPSGLHGGPIGQIVHAAMIALLALIAFGFAHFALRRGPGRPAILAGLVAYGLSLFGHVGAATINGFAVPALAARGHGAAGRDVFMFAWETNQALAQLGMVAGGVAFLLWSLDFLGRREAEPRLIGALGLLAGAVPILLLVAGWIALDVGGALFLYAVHGAWAALVGLHLVRGKVESVTPAG